MVGGCGLGGVCDYTNIKFSLPYQTIYIILCQIIYSVDYEENLELLVKGTP